MIEVFQSFADVPLDDPGFDGDDAIVPGEYGATFDFQAPRMLLSTAVTSRTMVAPYVRIEPGKHTGGMAVQALARGLWRAGFLHKAPGVSFTTNFGPIKQTALKRFKKAHGLPATPVYDQATHRLLAPYYDQWALAMLHAVKPPLTPADKLRLRVVGAGNFLYNHRHSLAYTQRRAYTVSKIPRLPLPGLDCSAGKAWCDYNAGAPEPSGYRSFGYGNTYTQLDRYRRLGRANYPNAESIRQAKIGDPIYYLGHVAWVISKPAGGKVRVWSFGSYPIRILDWDYRSDAVAVCDLLA